MNLLKKTVNRDLILSGNMVQAIMSIAIPVVINSFLQTMYNLTDTFWLGKIGTEQLAAINLVTPVQSIIMNFGSGITVADSVLIAQYIGAKDDENAKSMANQIFACAMIFAFVCAGLCFLFTPAIVKWLGADGNTLKYGRIYLQKTLTFKLIKPSFSYVHKKAFLLPFTRTSCSYHRGKELLYMYLEMLGQNLMLPVVFSLISRFLSVIKLSTYKIFYIMPNIVLFLQKLVREVFMNNIIILFEK